MDGNYLSLDTALAVRLGIGLCVSLPYMAQLVILSYIKK